MKKIPLVVMGFWRQLIQRPFYFFGAISLVFGSIFILLVPPFQSPDEFTHFTRTYEVSEFKIARDHFEKNKHTRGSLLPKSIGQTYDAVYLQQRARLPDVPQAKKYSLGQAKKALAIPLDKNVLKYYNTGSDPTYVPILYVPQALTVKILSLINSPILVMLYATRIIGLLIWVLLALVALKIMRPTNRRFALASVLLLPMFVAQASASTDPLLNGLTVLFLAIMTNVLISKKQLTLKLIVVLSATLTLMIMAKPAYIVFGLLVLAAKVNTSVVKGLVVKLLCLGIPFILYGFWTLLTRNTAGPLYVDAIAASNAIPHEQASYLFANIFNFFEPFINTLLLGWGDGVYASMIGNFGRLDTPLPTLFVTIGYIFTAVAIFVGPEESTEAKMSQQFCHRKTAAWLTLIVAVVYTVGVYLAMYVYSTPPREQVITGVQGRYLLPLLPLLVLFVSKALLTMRAKAYTLLMITAPLVLLIVSTIAIYLRFYIVYP